MAGGEVGESGGDVGEEFNLLVGDGLREAFDAAMFFFGEGHIGELLEAGDEGAAKAVEAITVGEDGGVLDAVEVAADLFRSVDTVIKVGDEAGDSALEIDVVFPKRVIGVDEQCLVGGATERLARAWGRHRLIIKV